MPPKLVALKSGGAVAPRIEGIILDFVLVGILHLGGSVSASDGGRSS